MAGAAEFAEVEARIAAMTDAELVEMDTHPGDYEPWALELGRAELGRRNLPTEHVAQLADENEREARNLERGRVTGMRRLMLWVASGAVLLAAPIFGVARGFLADREARGFAADCARMFAQDAGATSDGNETRLGMHTIAIDVAIEQDRVLPTTGKHAVGVRVDCEVERHAESALRGGVAGVGDTRADAIKDALAMWVGSFGRPIADAVTGRPPLRKAGIFSVYAGRTAVRGADPDGLVDFHDRFFRELEPGLLPILTTNTMHGISILAMSAGGDDRLELEFRLDGEVSSRLRELTAKMSWPRANGSSLMRQFYVLVPR